MDDFLNVDEDLVVADYPTDADILDSVIHGSEHQEDAIIPSPPKREVLHSFEIIRRTFQSAKDIFLTLNECKHFCDKLCATKIVQQDIRTYLNMNVNVLRTMNFEKN